jgi:light-harvesting protein B-800-850 alpha chain
MNQGRIWCVVSPTVGLPLLLGGVATISFIVHFAVLNNTSWIQSYWAGSSHTTVAAKASSGTEVMAQAQSQAPPAG